VELEKYQLENGHCLVPHDHPLGPWVGRQRSDRTGMSQDRVDKLDRIGFIWDAKENTWDNHYEKLLEYKRDHGDCKVPKNHFLYQWVHNQKELQSLIDSALAISSENKCRLDLLNSIGFFQKCKRKGCNEDRYLSMKGEKRGRRERRESARMLPLFPKAEGNPPSPLKSYSRFRVASLYVYVSSCASSKKPRLIPQNMKRSKSIRILIVSIIAAVYLQQCESFTHHGISIIDKCSNYESAILPKMVASRDVDEERKTRSVAVISKSEDYVKFLEEDDQLCVIKFYASWCKSCAKFGMKYNKLAHDYGDRIRFAEVEYGANAMLCKTLKVRSLPTVHMYKKGKGKVSQMTKRPSEFQDVVDEIDRLLSLDDEVESVEEETYTMNTASNATVDTQFEQTMRDGGNLSIEIMAKIKEQEREEKTKRSTKENSWFTFPFTF
ncbi:hypothetical protein ACHAXN_012148, partial [Cyclotella atomus]